MIDDGQSTATQRGIDRVLVACSAAFVLVFAVVALARIGYPYELEWMGGAFLDHVARLLDGQKIYVPPTPDFVPFLYTPLYFYLGAAVSLVVGEGFAALRLVSILATVATLALLALLLWRRTRRALPAIVGVGLYAACYGLVDSWYDTARADSLFVAFVTAALAFVLLGEGRRSAILAAVALVVAFLSKQTAFLLAPPLCIALAFRGRDRALWFAGSFVVGWGASVGILEWIHGGWFWFYTWELPRRHEYTVAPLFEFWFGDLLPVYPLLLLGGAHLAHLWRSGERRGFFATGAWCGGLLLASCLSRMHVGGAKNVLMPAYLGLCVLAGIALAAARTGPLWMRRAAPIALLVQFALLVYDPRPFVPSAADQAVGDRLVQTLREADGPVVVPLHGYLPRMAGKRPGAHVMAVLDVVRANEPGISEELENAYWNTIREREVELVVLDDNLEPFVRTPLNPDRGYELGELGFASEDAIGDAALFYPVVGLRTRPRWVFRRPR